MDTTPRFDTRAVLDGSESPAGDVVPPIHLSSTYELPGIDPELRLEDVDPSAGEFLYGRLSNPTRHAVENQLATLEGGEMGFAFSSGTAAIATAVLSVVEPGDHLVAFDDLYAGTRRMFEALFDDQLDVDVEFVDATDLETVQSAVGDDTAMVWMETPTNPLIHLCDVEAIAQIAAEHGAVFGVDNTFASPYFQRPLDLGADLVAHSTTKYLNGHSDGIGGAVVTDDPEVAEALGFRQQVALGNGLAPFDSYLLARGLKTLGVRMRQHEENALALAEYLEAHDRVQEVYYPGLESHPQHELASRQMDGYGGVLSFELEGDLWDAKAFLEAVETMTLAVSLGGVETLIEHPATMTHEPLGPDRRAEVGISDSLIRVSVGIEDVRDLRADFERGFTAIAAPEARP
ncbi:PLP-dependent aspartate aminotransferase family protein [Halalkaliarchaeum sp. AArc-GB]|uniref:trans-sulfuration enzyme family protein n=1 Tax=Halalkaliarchaeum sp. AArc-GB TaxID=3074078 RepID=UPI00285BA5D3|nr:PLP-dependent aspartate aminotransferase family protein [Halalkaliarchaeum sp. AArc-GB]MDR5673048.1 PLP-dependent aspartate aminotransferase family protein [Halalkaliarchaeum sp. AArc-GB]